MEPAIGKRRQRFTINYGCQENLFGVWEIVDINDSPYYLCVKVLKGGKLSKGKNLNCKRLFYVSSIKQTLAADFDFGEDNGTQ